MKQTSKIKLTPPKIIQPNIKRTLFLIMLLCLFFLAAIWFSYQYGLKETAEIRTIIMGTDQQINDQTNRLVMANEKLNEQLVHCQSSTKINQIANNKVKQQIEQEQDQKLALKKQNGLLNNLISSNQAKDDALQIMDFKLTKVPKKSRTYTYGFTITHLKQDKKQLNGQVFFSVKGSQNNKKKYLKMNEITRKKISYKTLKFIHFQRIEGEIIIPKNFVPTAFIISSKVKNKKINEIKERFSWELTKK